MITGRSDADGRITINIRVSDGGPPHRTVTAVVATESIVELALPRLIIAQLGLTPLGDDSFTMVGEPQSARSYIAYVEWVRGLTPVIAVETPGEPLIGQGLLRGSFLRADFMDGGEVAVYGID